MGSSHHRGVDGDREPRVGFHGQRYAEQSVGLGTARGRHAKYRLVLSGDHIGCDMDFHWNEHRLRSR
ncbi:MAG: hypothetical protein EBV88_02915, partial [Actinobacteria bacterium]|nr:hypothetical protein [Actinomycetota bacterium]